MLKSLLLAALISIATVLAAQAPQAGAPTPAQTADSSQPPKPQALCTVSGKVLSASDGSPVRSARVSLLMENFNASNIKSQTGSYSTSTDGEGKFEIDYVAPGRYRFKAARTGYVSREYRDSVSGTAALLALDPGQHLTDVVFRLPRTAAVTGHVIDENGDPLAGIQISALRKSKPRNRKSSRSSGDDLIALGIAVTNDLGEYRIFGLKPGEYIFRAIDGGPDEASGLTHGGTGFERERDYEYLPLYYPGVLQSDQAQSLVLRAGDEGSIDFALRAGKYVHLSGLVVGMSGRPAQGYVTLQSTEANSMSRMMNHSTDIDSDGKFIFKQVLQGSYIIESQMSENDHHYSTRQKIDVGTENIDSLILAFTHGVKLSGRLTIAGGGTPNFKYSQVELEAVGDDTRSNAYGKLQKDGSFETNEMPEGGYILDVFGLGPHWHIKSASLGSGDVLEKGVQIEKNMASTTLEIVVSSVGAEVDGSVTMDNKPLGGATVRVVLQPETPYTRFRNLDARTDQHGNFTLHEIPPGKYEITAYRGSGDDDDDDDGQPSEPQTVTVGEHEHKSVQLEIKAPTSQ